MTAMTTDNSTNEPLTIDHDHLSRIGAAVKDVGRVASVATVRAALADVADAGWNGRPWTLDPTDETEAQTVHRAAFINAIITRIAELQAAPHLYDESLLAKLRDRKAEYHRGYSNGWEDAMADREEMRRKVEEGVR